MIKNLSINDKKVKEYNFIIDEIITTYFVEFREDYYEDMMQEGFVGLLSALINGKNLVGNNIKKSIAGYLKTNVLPEVDAPLRIKRKYLKVKNLIKEGFSQPEALEIANMTDLVYTNLELGIYCPPVEELRLEDMGNVKVRIENNPSRKCEVIHINQN